MSLSLFYNLERFSVDLDFDLLDKEKENYVFERTKKISENYGALKQAEKKRFNLIYVLSYSGKRQDAQIGKTNRDIFDVWYFLQNEWSINRKIVEDRTGMDFKEFLQECINLLEKMSD